MLIEHVDKIVGLRRNLVLEESRFPAELNASFTAMERYGNPWGQPASLAGSTGRRACRSPCPPPPRSPRRRARTPSRSWSASTGSAARPPSTTATSGSREPSSPAWRRPACATRCSARKRAAAAIRRAGWATSTSTRCWPRPTSRRSTATGRRPSSRPARTASTRIGNEYGQFGGTYEVVHHSTYLARLVGEGRLRTEAAETASGRRRRAA